MKSLGYVTGIASDRKSSCVREVEVLQQQDDHMTHLLTVDESFKNFTFRDVYSKEGISYSKLRSRAIRDSSSKAVR